METPDLKHCPICNNDLPISEFGIVRARAHLDGRNLYCRSCIRAKVNASRQAIREYKALRKKHQAKGIEYRDEAFEPKPRPLPNPLSKLSKLEKVLDAIKRGHRTQKEIRIETKLSKDEIGDALANLLLWTKEIKTQLVGETRMYFQNEQKENVQVNYPIAESWVEIARKANVREMIRERTIQKVA